MNHNWRVCFTIPVALLALLIAACSKPAPVKEYALHGVVVSVDLQSKSAAIHNDKIEGWMEPMTMDYPVKDSASLAKLAPGDEISAKLYVRDVGYWLEIVNVVGHQKKP